MRVRRRTAHSEPACALAFIAIGCASASFACSRKPPEPLARARAEAPESEQASGTPALTSSGGTDDRCIRPLANTAPRVPPVAQRCPEAPEPGPELAHAEVVFEAKSPWRVDVEIARSHDETSRGLMYRTELGESAGMLFDMRERSVHTFWMRNTCIPLDMVFVDEDGTIVGIAESVPVLNDTPRTVGCPSRWVIETRAGACRKHGVRPGQRVKLPKKAP